MAASRAGARRRPAPSARGWRGVAVRSRSRPGAERPPQGGPRPLSPPFARAPHDLCACRGAPVPAGTRPCADRWEDALPEVPVAMAEGIHPFPSRTRPCPPSAPMVPGGQPPGRVGRRRSVFRKGPQEARPYPGGGPPAVPSVTHRLVLVRKQRVDPCAGVSVGSKAGPRQSAAGGSAVCRRGPLGGRSPPRPPGGCVGGAFGPRGEMPPRGGPASLAELCRGGPFRFSLAQGAPPPVCDHRRKPGTNHSYPQRIGGACEATRRSL